MDLTSGAPFWIVRDGLIHAYPLLDADIQCSTVVIGAGITGALVAHHLIEAGVDTVIVDKRDVASGSTSASTALIQYEIDVTLCDLADMIGRYNAERAYLVCRDAVDKLGKLALTTADKSGFKKKRSLYLASSRHDRNVLRTEREMRRAIGLHVDWLDESDIAEEFSFKRPGALLSQDAA